MAITNAQLYGSIAVAFVLLIVRLLQVGKRSKNLPPGPPTTPILGNLSDIPPRYAHLKFMELARQYGPVISLKIFHQNMIVLNDARSIHEILDKRSSSSSDRAPMHINDTLIAQNNHILIANGARSALFRKLWNLTLSKDRVADHIPLQNAEGLAVLKNVLDRPDNFYEEMRRYSCSLTLSIAYGKRAPTFSTPDASGFTVKEFYQAEHDFNFFLEVGATPPIDIIPALKYLPGPLAPWKAHAKKVRKTMKGLYLNKLFKEVKMKMERGMRTGCWMEKIIERSDGLDDEALAWNGGVMLEGGSDTTSGALLTFVLAAVLHPRTLETAQKELDEVVGSERSPTIEDFDNLPYCAAFIYEVMRWRPVAPAGVPHVTTKDEVYQGMLIPKGSTVVGNTWAVLHDPEQYENPDEFNPDRFMKTKFGTKPGATDDEDRRQTFPYGAGRRICLGMHLAENSLKIQFPKLLWAFNYAQAIDPGTKQPIPVSRDAFEPGHLTAPLPFKCTITPRSEAIAATIRREYAEVEPFLKQFEVSIPVA